MEGNGGIKRKRTVGDASVEIVRDGIVELVVDDVDEYLLVGVGHLEKRRKEGTEGTERKGGKGGKGSGVRGG